VRVRLELKGRKEFGRASGVQDATHSVARHLVSEKSLLSSKRRYRLAKWVMPKFRFTKSKILIEPEGAKSIDGEHSFRLKFPRVWSRIHSRWACASVVVHSCALARGGCRSKGFLL